MAASAIDLLGSARDLLRTLRARRISAEDLLSLHLERIQRLDGEVGAVVTVDSTSSKDSARRFDGATMADAMSRPLGGLPMTVKDSLCTAGMRTTAGEPSLINHVPTEDATAIARLRAAGAILFGKTNLPAMAADIQTYNPLFGVTRNPWNGLLTAGGSSGGSAAALAMGFTPLEVGSDIAGSLRIPAHCCGIYAHKPSFDVVPDRGHIPPPPGVVAGTDIGSIGPMARSAEDLELLLDVLVTPSDPARPGWRPHIPESRHSTLKDFRIALWMDDPCCPVDDETRAMMEETAAGISRAGARINSRARPFEDFSTVAEAYLDLVIPLLASGVPDALMAELPEQALRASASSAKYLRRIIAGSSQSRASYFSAKEIQARTIEEWGRFFMEFDALICPVMPSAAFAHMTGGLSFARSIEVAGIERPYWDQALWCGALASFAYLPATARPIQLSGRGVPMGVQIVGPYLEDRTCLALARLMDDIFGGFQPPPAALGKYAGTS
jgi:amidase